MTMGLRARYALVGGLLAMGSPLGLLAVRVSTDRPRLAAVTRELSANASTYAYLAISTTIAFAWFGARLGHAADRLAELSQIDPLTGLGNRRYFQRQLDYWVEQGNRHHTSMTLLLVDVDGLKRINDKRGHAAGDATLRRVANAVRNSLRQTDIAARIGGDEFGVLAPFTGLSDGLVLGERLVASVARQAPARAAESISVGVAVTAPDPAIDRATACEALFAAADAALYRAKESGRARVVAA